MELTDQQFDALQNANYSFIEKVKGFFWHIYMVAFAPHDAKRAIYLDEFDAYERKRAAVKSS
jgi:hypothetical protein